MDESTIQAAETTQQQEHPAPAPEHPDAAPTAADATAKTVNEAAADETASAAAPAQTETEKPCQEPKTDDPAQALAALTGKAAEAELRAAAAMAGVSPERLPYALRMCDRDALCAQGADMQALAREQIAAVLRDVPELAGRSGTLPGSLGDHKRVGSAQSAEDEARAAFSKYLK